MNSNKIAQQIEQINERIYEVNERIYELQGGRSLNISELKKVEKTKNKLVKKKDKLFKKMLEGHETNESNLQD